MLLIPQSEVAIGWLATGASFMVGTGAWLCLHHAEGEHRDRPSQAAAFAQVARLSLVAYAVTLLLAIALALPLLLVLWPISPWIGSAAVVVGVNLAVPRTLFALPGIVAGDDASTAFDRSAAWVSMAPLRTAAGTAACLVASLGPAVGVAAVGFAMDMPVIEQRLGILAALTLSGPCLAAWMASWARTLDDRKRRQDVGFARP